VSIQWEDVDPIVKTIPKLQAGIYANSDGKWRLRLSFSTLFMHDLKEPNRANVQIGWDGEPPMVRIVLEKSGKFNIPMLGKGSARIQNIPCPAKLNPRHRDIEECEILSADPTAVVAKLPIEAWKAQVATKPESSIPKRQADPAPQEETRKPGTNGAIRIDANQYLKNRGHKCAAIAGGYYMVDGQRCSKMEVLAIINRYRSKADVGPITIEQFD
jgi:hypothetical protein